MINNIWFEISLRKSMSAKNNYNSKEVRMIYIVFQCYIVHSWKWKYVGNNTQLQWVFENYYPNREGAHIICMRCDVSLEERKT